MAGKVVGGAAAGAGIGATIGGPAAPLTAAVGAVVGAAVGVVTNIFKSKKHYNLYYWDSVNFAWVYAMEGHPDAVKKLEKSYSMSGITTQIVRNKSGSAVAPTKPPAGVTASAPSGFNPWILAGIAGAGLLAFVLLKKGR